MTFIARLTHTSNDFTLPVARWVLAAIFFGLGAQEAFGWFDVVAIALLLILIVQGSGAVSVDRLLARGRAASARVA